MKQLIWKRGTNDVYPWVHTAKYILNLLTLLLKELFSIFYSFIQWIGFGKVERNSKTRMNRMQMKITMPMKTSLVDFFLYIIFIYFFVFCLYIQILLLLLCLMLAILNLLTKRIYRRFAFYTLVLSKL